MPVHSVMRAMQPFHLVQLSNPCLNRDLAHRPGWERVVAAINDDAPDLVVVTGNLTLRGAEHDDDLAFAGAELLRLGCPVLPLPGPRDIGVCHGDRPAEVARTAAARTRYLEHFGAGWWLRDIGGWRLFGLDTLLFGTGLDAEIDQLGWLEAAIRDAPASRPAAVFWHRPPFPADGGLSTELASEALALLRSADVRLFAAGDPHAEGPIVRRHMFDADAAVPTAAPPEPRLEGPVPARVQAPFPPIGIRRPLTADRHENVRQA